VLVVTQSNAAASNIQERMDVFGVPCVRVGMHMQSEEFLSQRFFRSLCEEKEIADLEGAYDEPTRRAILSPLLQKVVKKAPVVVMTCISSGNMGLLGQVRFSRVLLDEAAQATEPTSLVPLMTGASAFACVGDDKQLPATVVSRQAQAGGLSESLFERLLKAGVCTPGSGFVQLDVQRRMHSSIASFPSRMFYNNQIENGCRDTDRPLIPGLRWPQNGDCRVLFVDMGNCSEEEKIGTSTRNVEEAILLLKVSQRLAEHSSYPYDYGEQISVAAITGYAAQKEELKNRIRQTGAGLYRACQNLRVDTVDGFQGMERDLVLVSTVRNNLSQEVGFLRDARRTNVLLTRARRGLIVFGSYRTLQSERHVWAPWLQWIEAHNACISAADLKGQLGLP